VNLWVSLPLKPDEVLTKRKANLEYYWQILVMARYLLSFSRSNEFFIMENWGMVKKIMVLRLRECR